MPKASKTQQIAYKTSRFELADLKPAKYNPRTISDDAFDGLSASIDRFGLVEPIIVNIRDKKNIIVGGHQRFRVLRTKGVTAIDCVTVDLSEEDEKLLNLALNNPHTQGKFIDDLSAYIEKFKETMTSDEAFLQLRIDKLTKEIADSDSDDDADQDNIPDLPKKATRTKKGDLWLLGEHRLIVGDSTDEKTIDRLMAGNKAHLVHTDPPYGVSYVSTSGKFEMLKNDDKQRDALVKGLLLPAFKLAAKHSRQDAAFYIWHASSTRDDFAYAMRAAGLLEKQYIIWVKPSIVLGHADYHWAHEPCFYAEKQGCTAAFYGDRTQSTVWRATLKASDVATTTLGNGLLLLDGKGASLHLSPSPPKGKKLRTIRIEEGKSLQVAPGSTTSTIWEVGRDSNPDHPTQKPAELAKRAIENSTLPGESVLDLFGGSGSTLIAAEITERKAFICELDPKYGDVICERWERFTGREAVKAK